MQTMHMIPGVQLALYCEVGDGKCCSLIWHEVIINLQQFKSKLTCNFSNFKVIAFTTSSEILFSISSLGFSQ